MPSDHLFTRTRALFHCRHGPTSLFIPGSSCRGDSRLPDFYLVQLRPSSTKPPPIVVDPLVDVNSLANTLDAYRTANRTPGLYTRYAIDHEGKFTKSDEGADDHFALAQSLGSRSLRGSLRSNQIGSGKVARPVTQWALTTHSKTPAIQRVPWTKKSYQKTLPGSPWLSAEERLSQEIEAFEAYVSPTKEEQTAAELAASDLRRVIKNAETQMDMDIIGSRSTGTADPLSDIDVNVSLPVTPSSMKARIQPEQILTTIRSSIRGWRWNHQNQECPIETVLHVKKAVVPILLCRHRQTGLPIQIQATPRTFDSTEYVRSFLKEFPTLRSLFKVLRQVLHMRELHNGQHGGLTSYPLLNMIVASLKMSEGKSAPSNSGAHLLHFLDLYSEIDFVAMGISTRPLGLFSRKDDVETEVDKAAKASGLYTTELQGQKHMIVRTRKSGAKMMILQDPANPMNNLGKSAFRIRDVQETFIYLRHRLRMAMEAWDKTQAQAGDDAPIPKKPADPYISQSVLKVLLEGDYRLYEYDRGDIKRAVRDLSHTATSKIRAEQLDLEGELDVPPSSLKQQSISMADEDIGLGNVEGSSKETVQ